VEVKDPWSLLSDEELLEAVERELPLGPHRDKAASHLVFGVPSGYPHVLAVAEYNKIGRPAYLAVRRRLKDVGHDPEAALQRRIEKVKHKGPPLPRPRGRFRDLWRRIWRISFDRGRLD
jgi:hypothetical protein